MLSLTTCTKAKNIDKNTSKRNIIHLAITETGCSRYESSPSSIFVPLTSTSNSIVQTFKDLMDMNTLTWKSMIMLYDPQSVDSALINDLKSLLSGEIPVAEFDLGSNPQASISGILSKLPHGLSNQFLVLSKESDVSMISTAAENAGLTTLDHQWLYVVTDTNRNSEMMPPELTNAKDGQNVAFLFNSSTVEEGNNCQGGLLCFTEELIRTFAAGLKDTLDAEMETYFSVTSEEWAMLKPKPLNRAQELTAKIKGYINQEGRCGNCSGWTLKSSELVDLESGPNVVEVGLWEPKLGLVLLDDLFPHVSGGLRGRQLTVASNHVSAKTQPYFRISRNLSHFYPITNSIAVSTLACD